MKKPYISPHLEVEQFSLTQQLAACELLIHSLDSACVLATPGLPPSAWDLANAGVFISGCTFEPTGMDELDGICYNTSINAGWKS